MLPEDTLHIRFRPRSERRMFVAFRSLSGHSRSSDAGRARGTRISAASRLEAPVYAFVPRLRVSDRAHRPLRADQHPVVALEATAWSRS